MLPRRQWWWRRVDGRGSVFVATVLVVALGCSDGEAQREIPPDVIGEEQADVTYLDSQFLSGGPGVAVQVGGDGLRGGGPNRSPELVPRPFVSVHYLGGAEVRTLPELPAEHSVDVQDALVVGDSVYAILTDCDAHYYEGVRCVAPGLERQLLVSEENGEWRELKLPDDVLAATGTQVAAHPRLHRLADKLLLSAGVPTTSDPSGVHTAYSAGLWSSGDGIEWEAHATGLELSSGTFAYGSSVCVEGSSVLLVGYRESLDRDRHTLAIPATADAVVLRLDENLQYLEEVSRPAQFSQELGDVSLSCTEEGAWLRTEVEFSWLPLSSATFGPVEAVADDPMRTGAYLVDVATGMLLSTGPSGFLVLESAKSGWEQVEALEPEPTTNMVLWDGGVYELPAVPDPLPPGSLKTAAMQVAG